MPELDEFAFVNNSELHQRLDAGEAILVVDFRVSPAERAKGLIACDELLQIPLDGLLDPAMRAHLSEAATIVTVTETGNRDKIVQRFLSQHGFDNIVGLKDGFRGWVKAGLPLRSKDPS